jgi:two-component system cell cycle response regulator
VTSASEALRRILAVSDALAGDLEFDQALGLVADSAVVVAGATHASVRLLAPDEGILLASARAGEGSTAPPKAFRRGEGLMGWVLEFGQGLVVGDVNADARYDRVEGQGFEIGSMILEPLVVGGVVVGVLSASSPQVNAFGSDQAMAFKLLARCTQFPLERARLQRMAVLDHLTLAFAPSTLASKLAHILDEARVTGGDVSLLFLDLDHFKAVNDTHGHGTGDAVLKRFASEVRATIRKRDVFIRRGGEEFVLLLTEADAVDAFAMAERIRKRIEALELVDGTTRVRVSTSIGVATWNREESGVALERRADEAVYVAKSLGRNRSVAAPDAAVNDDGGA